MGIPRPPKQLPFNYQSFEQVGLSAKEAYEYMDGNSFDKVDIYSCPRDKVDIHIYTNGREVIEVRGFMGHFDFHSATLYMR